jgi:8-oxo-dGTP pyrophosphatase MutT (NUDIX family)
MYEKISRFSTDRAQSAFFTRMANNYFFLYYVSMNISESDIRKALVRSNAIRKTHKPGQRRAAVLIPLVHHNNRLEVILTTRTDQVEHHKGQISFPGGAVDDDDRSLIDAALRETQEELGINPRSVEILGTIDDVSTPSHFLITPIIGFLRSLPAFTINNREVDEAFSVPLSFFTDAANVRIEYREIDGKNREVYFYEYGDKVIWGATAYMLRIFLRTVTDGILGD